MSVLTTKEVDNAREVFNVFRKELDVTFDSSEALELEYKIRVESDFSINIDGMELRLIDESSIRDIAQEEIAETISECYLQTFDGKDLPWWIELDWDKTVQNCIDADGYGHHFSTYDGNEYEAGGWYIFRTN